MIEIEDKETRFKCKIYCAVPIDTYTANLEKRRVKALKAFMRLCKEGRRDKTSNHR